MTFQTNIIRENQYFQIRAQSVAAKNKNTEFQKKELYARKGQFF